MKKVKHLFLCLLAVLLTVGTQQAWADDVITIDEKDTSMGKLKIIISGDDPDVFHDDRDKADEDFRNRVFQTKTFFDNVNGAWYHEFYLLQWIKDEGDDELSHIRGDINFYVITDSKDTINVATISHNESGDIKNVETKAGTLVHGDKDHTYRFYPQQFYMNKISEMYWDMDYRVCRHDFGHAKDKNQHLKVYKNKDKHGLKFTYTPMPMGEMSVGANGYLHFEARDVPGHASSCYYKWYARHTGTSIWGSTYILDLTGKDTGWSSNKNLNQVSITGNTGRLSPLHGYRVRYKGSITDKYEYQSPESEWFDAFVPGYLYPRDLSVISYDQWNKKVTISWNAVREDTEYATGYTYDRNTAGSWMIYREEPSTNGGLPTYLGTLSGNKTDNELTYTDSNIEYDKTYTYRVIFLPDVMKNDDVLSWFEKELQPTTKSLTTTRNVPIDLSQIYDETISGIKLKWTYNIQKNGGSFRVERRNDENHPWEVLAGSQQNAITSQDSAIYIDTTPTSSCDFYDYRVVASTLDTEFASNILEHCHLSAGTSVLAIDATKGTESSVAVINWTVAQRGEEETYFDIERRPITNGEMGDWMKVGETHGTASEYTFTDERVEAGSYYEYRIVAYGLLCDNQVSKSHEMTTIGYSQARGTITGHISYGTGTSVGGVRVNLIKSGTDIDQQQFFSRYINGTGSALSWTPDSERYSEKLTSEKPLSLQLWFAPEAKEDNSNMPLFAFGKQEGSAVALNLEKKGDDKYALQLVVGSQKETIDFDVPIYRYSHLSVVYNNNKWNFILNGDTANVKTVANPGSWQLADGTSSFHVGSDGAISPKCFSGLVDDIRLWSRALELDDVVTNYDRVIGGTEPGLVLYWPMDEGIDGHTYDVSKQNGISNENHPDVAPNATPSHITPADLKLYGVTDSDGNYIITGIPFDAGGTNYKLLPDFGIHEFQPSSRSLYVSPSSLTANNVDFTDKSSFPMRGYVYYAGTNIPAKGIYLYVDGELVTTGGKIAETNEDGFYEISVPIGKHFVEAKQSGHSMANAGRWPTTGTYDFQASVLQNFTDSTLVNFCGRVAGGEVQEKKPVGFGIASGSKNNIGIATVKLALNNPNLSFNCVEGTTTDLTKVRPFDAQNPDTIMSSTWAGAGDDSRYIFIRTDSVTGEFSALLPPLKYNVSSITVDNNPDVKITDLPQIDLTNVIAYEVDTLHVNNSAGDTLKTNLKDADIRYYKYNKKMVSAWYAEPILEVVDQADKLNIGAYGMMKMYHYEDEFGKVDSIEIYRAANGAPEYLYGYPIYQMQDPYAFDIYGYEHYVNYDSGTPIPDDVPMSHQILTVSNEMGAEQAVVVKTDEEKGVTEGEVYNLKENQILLDKDGRYTYKWQAGLPNSVDPYTRHLGITYDRNNRSFSWTGLDAYVFGTLPLGNNFVTKGPDNVMMVLRDPPGGASSTSWTSGSAHTDSYTWQVGLAGNAGISAEMTYGTDLKTAEGIGIAIVTTSSVKNRSHFGVEVEASLMDTGNRTYTITSTETISTSSDPEYVGADGDVYIGASTNLLIGNCKKVGFFRESANSGFDVKDSIAISVSDSITTLFNYTALEIEEKQIPSWQNMVRQLVIPVADEKTANSYSNDKQWPVFVSWEKGDLFDTYKNKTYKTVVGKDPTWQYRDSVEFYAEQVEHWEHVIYMNEEDKCKSMSADSPYFDDMRNISFDSGSPYSYTEKADTTHTNGVDFNIAVTIGGDIAFGVDFASGAKFALDLMIKGGFGPKGEIHYEHTWENTAEFEYKLDLNSPVSDMSVDIYKSPNNWSDVFRVRAGQTACPYQGQEVTKYYKPGTELSSATTQIEKPQVRISNGQQNPSKHAVINDVPAGSSANFTLSLYNDSEAREDITYVLRQNDESNSNGLKLMIDGVTLSDGRSFVVNAGEVLTKTLTVSQSDFSVLDYEGLGLSLISACQGDPTSFHPVIGDTCTFDIHFKPSSSPVTLMADAFVVNNTSAGKLDLKLTNFDRSFQGLKSMGVEYKAEGDAQWNRVQNYVFAKADSTDRDDIVVPETGDVRLIIDMSDKNSYPDRTYVFRAYTETPYGAESVRTYSDELTVVKDMARPTAIGTPQPTDGILHAGDDIVVEFNEDIVPGYVNASNVQVTAKVNSQPTTHEVSLHLSGNEPTAATASDFFMRGNSSVGMWLKYTQPGTIFSHCTGDNALTLGVDADGHLIVNVGTTHKVSELILPKDEWTYLAYSYNEETKELNVVVQHGNETENRKSIFDSGRSLQQVVYAENKQFYLGGGGLEADVHDLRIYSICRDAMEVASEKYNPLMTYTAGLMAHWPLDEGQGTKARDLRNDAHPLVLSAPNWHIDGTNYAATVDAAKQQHLDLNIATATTDANESYVLEFWFRADDKMAGKTVFQAGSDADNNLRLFTRDDGQLFFEYGIHLMPVAPDSFDISGGWHHFALNVMRGASASVSIDGKRTAVFAEADVPPFEGAKLVMGAGFQTPLGENYSYKDFMTGAFDEVRFWKGMLKPEVIKSGMYQGVDTLEAAAKGLTVYYPMEATANVAGVETKVASDADMAPGQLMPGTMTGNFDLSAFTLNAPPVKRKPETQTVICNATVSDRKVLVELQPLSLAEIEGTTLDVTVSKIFDMNGNTSLPITWQVYVNQNTLLWAKDSVTCIKKYGDEATFQVEIVNKGNATEYYSIDNLPTWLSTDDAQGEVAPDSRQAIRFSVAPTTAVGNYDINLSLVGNNEIKEPLRLVLNVKGQTPDWAVATDSIFEDQMNLVGQVLIDGFVNENKESRLAAFIGNTCVGVAQPEKARGSFYVPMTIYGSADKHNGKTISFKFWDASTGITYVGLKSSTDVQFKRNAMKGSYNYPILFTNSGEVEQDIDVAAGWNWISTSVKPAKDQTLTDILVSDGFLKGDVLKDKSDVSYNDGNGWNTGTLKTIQPTNMYKLYVHQPLDIVIRGEECVPSQTSVTVQNGWNWIGFVPMAAMDVNQALAGIRAVEGDYIKSKTAFAIYGPYGWEGNLKALEPGQGYMFYWQGDSTTFTYPNVAAVRNMAPSRVKAAPSHHFTPVNSGLYPDNMSVVVQMLCNGEPVDSLELAAFIDGECRAVAQADGGLYYLMVQGEGTGQNVQLCTFYKNRNFVVDEGLSFRPDTNIGLPWEPYTVDIAAIVTGTDIVVNDQKGGDSVKYFLPNGIQIPQSALRKGQVYIRREQNGTFTKYTK